ncbi:MAG: methylmalonyl Co-A mutase-associated GTPase MeaB [Anaerolineae bacterium]
MSHRRGDALDGTRLAELAVGGDRRAVARLLTLVENGEPEGRLALAKLFPRTGNAHVVGFTGSTGVGKSTLVNRVAGEIRGRGPKLAIVAVDPTSPFSGGALLGDRLRMRDLVEDPGVFIRSMASRGHPGGVAHATRDVVTVLDALGFPIILVETVGAGQVQVEVARIAHTVVLVEAPGMGDDIQALKAGLMEIADIIVVNKADRPEARQTLVAIRSAGLQGVRFQASEAASEPGAWEVPVLETSALEGQGIPELVDAVMRHRDYLQRSEIWDSLRMRHARAEVEAWLHRYLEDWVRQHIGPDVIEDAIEAVVRRRTDPASAARNLLEALVGPLSS